MLGAWLRWGGACGGGAGTVLPSLSYPASGYPVTAFGSSGVGVGWWSAGGGAASACPVTGSLVVGGPSGPALPFPGNVYMCFFLFLNTHYVYSGPLVRIWYVCLPQSSQDSDVRAVNRPTLLHNSEVME